MALAIQTAKDRAEEWLQTLQERGRKLWDTEEGAVRAVRDLVDKQGLAPHEVRRRFDELRDRIRYTHVWDKLRGSDPVGKLTDYRSQFESRADAQVQRLLASLHVATKADVDELGKQLQTLRGRLSDLGKKVKDN